MARYFQKNANVLFESLVFEVLSGCNLRIESNAFLMHYDLLISYGYLYTVQKQKVKRPHRGFKIILENPQAHSLVVSIMREFQEFSLFQ